MNRQDILNGVLIAAYRAAREPCCDSSKAELE
jgi:hypothetical protein